MMRLFDLVFVVLMILFIYLDVVVVVMCVWIRWSVCFGVNEE